MSRSDSRMDLGIAVGVLALALVVILAAAAVLYRRLSIGQSGLWLN